jgi:hypothetical protein
MDTKFSKVTNFLKMASWWFQGGSRVASGWLQGGFRKVYLNPRIFSDVYEAICEDFSLLDQKHILYQQIC